MQGKRGFLCIEFEAAVLNKAPENAPGQMRELRQGLDCHGLLLFHPFEQVMEVSVELAQHGNDKPPVEGLHGRGESDTR